MRICTLKRSVEFQRVRGGVRWSGPGFLIEGKARAHASASPDASRQETAMKPVTERRAAPACSGPRFGFTVTRKLGGAVERNLIRRRLRECLRQMPDSVASPDFDYVVVARHPAAERPFDELGRDFERAFAQMHRRTKAPRSTDTRQTD